MDKQSKPKNLLQPPANGSATYALPQMDLVGPTVHDDIWRAIQRYGADSVKAAVKEATKGKRGRPREPDWPELRAIFHADALDWLAGGDPFSTRSNYAIAKDFAERNPGHSLISTHKRIERKLSRGPHDRRWFTLLTAENISRDGFPFSVHLRALRAVASLPDKKTAEVWQSILDRALSTIADFEAREGIPPEPSMSFEQIEDAVEQSSLAALASSPKKGGLFGSATATQGPSGKGVLVSRLSEAVKKSAD